MVCYREVITLSCVFGIGAAADGAGCSQEVGEEAAHQESGVMEIGKNVKKYRELRAFTLPDLAARAGVSKAFLWEIETGNSKRPGAELLYKIAEALGVTIAHLMGKGSGDDARALIEPEINDGLRAFINERKLLRQPLEPEEIQSLSYVQLKGGRPQSKEQWSVVYGMLREMITASRS